MTLSSPQAAQLKGEPRATLERVISEHAPAVPPPLCPEISIHAAADMIAIWRAAERAVGAQVPAPFWAFAWPGGQALARAALDLRIAEGRTVVALAAGAGVEAIAAAISGARHVIWNDVDPLAETAFALNAALSGVTADIAIGDAAALLDDLSPGRDADAAFIGDAFYERTGAKRLIAAARRFAARGGRVFAADPDRGMRPDGGLNAIGEWRVPVDRDVEGVADRVAAVYQLR